MLIYHIATAESWKAALEAGEYRTSTLGMSIADVGFLHASFPAQILDVAEKFYAEVTEPLLLLAIDTDRLTAPLLAEDAPGTDMAFPHIYGPLNVDAVVEALGFERDAPSGRFALPAGVVTG